MSTRSLASDIPLLLILLLLAGCATGGPVVSMLSPSRRAPVQYAQSTDSATAGCLRNPACYKTLPGEEAVIPWVSRAVDAAHAATTMSVMLEGADIKVIEQVLTDCAQKANEKVNSEDEELQGREPTREQCKKVVRMEGGKEVTRAMELGAKKHEVALDCARKAFAERFTQNVRVEPTYQKDSRTRLWRWVDPKQVEEWLQLGLTSMLWGALVPDIVIHVSGNPNQVRHVYDFKFTCPAENPPSWRPSTRGQPHYPYDQGAMYKEALLEGRSKPSFATPQGIK
ncbi:hypothetical protein [Archangium lansingense]|uniref:Lipoprotein n=1 Tax=Archangium lansingense TaxID=2995310 RepID=A0ABT4AJ55_9BACT|nr:hypothetical protein [Archangium lansinium]MCY1080887.1 hypothetical protein [Archangium lansinium]